MKFLENLKMKFGIVKLNFATIELENGTILTIDGELEIGAPVFIEIDSEKIQAPAGKYVTAEGSVEIVIDEEGKIKEINELTEEEQIDHIVSEENMEDEAPEVVEEVITQEDVIEITLEMVNEKIDLLTLKVEQLLNAFTETIELVKSNKVGFNKHKQEFKKIINDIKKDIKNTRALIPAKNSQIEFNTNFKGEKSELRKRLEYEYKQINNG